MTNPSPANQLSDKEAADIGQMCRAAVGGNMVVGSFAAELAGASYPFSKAMCEIMFRTYDDKTLGRKFAKWCDNNEKVHAIAIVHKDCGVPKEGLEVPRYVAEAGGTHCKCCGAVMQVEEVTSIGMQQLGMYRVVCLECSHE